ncbi:hypothetical protein OAK75_02650 [Bacteriovoracales bacterium]|nr:hypothetical protein [Bacteriovoracales bacterium]
MTHLLYKVLPFDTRLSLENEFPMNRFSKRERKEKYKKRWLAKKVSRTMTPFKVTVPFYHGKGNDLE